MFSVSIPMDPLGLFMSFCDTQNHGDSYVQIRLINLIISELCFASNAYSVFQTYGTRMVCSCYFVCRRLMRVSSLYINEQLFRIIVLQDPVKQVSHNISPGFRF